MAAHSAWDKCLQPNTIPGRLNPKKESPDIVRYLPHSVK